MKFSEALAGLHKGAWSGVTAYIGGDIVESGGSSYICTQAHTNHVPPNASYWGLLAEQSSFSGRADVVVTTGSLAHGSTENNTVALGKTFVLLKLVVDKTCRVRLYSTAAARAADAARNFGTDPAAGTAHGLICDVLLSSSVSLSWIMSPEAPGSCMETVVATAIPYAITNLSGSTGTVQVTFTAAAMEL